MNQKKIFKTLIKKESKIDKKVDKFSSKNKIQKTLNYENKSQNNLSNIETMILTMSTAEIEKLRDDLKKDLNYGSLKNQEICKKGLAYIDYFTNCHLTSSYNEVYENEWTQSRLKFPKSDWYHYLFDYNFTDKQKKFITDYLLTCEINMFSESIKNEYNQLSPISFFSSIPNLQYLCMKICGPITQHENSFELTDSDEEKVCNANGEKCNDLTTKYDKVANETLIQNNIEYQQFHKFLIRVFSDMRNKSFKGCLRTYEYSNIQKYVEKTILHSSKAIEISKNNIEELENENKNIEFEEIELSI